VNGGKEKFHGQESSLRKLQEGGTRGAISHSNFSRKLSLGKSSEREHKSRRGMCSKRPSRTAEERDGAKSVLGPLRRIRGGGGFDRVSTRRMGGGEVP